MRYYHCNKAQAPWLGGFWESESGARFAELPMLEPGDMTIARSATHPPTVNRVEADGLYRLTYSESAALDAAGLI